MPTYHCNDPAARGNWRLSSPQIPSLGQLLVPSGGFGVSGIRGVVVLGHGWNDPPSNQQDISSTFLTNLQSDGWIVYVWPYPEDSFYQAGLSGGTSPSTGVAQDVINDAGFGSRFLATALESWDHVKWWLQNIMPTKHGASAAIPTLPLVMFGVSWGGWHAIQVALNRSADLTAWGAYIPVVQVSALSPLITGPYAWPPQPAYNSGTTYTTAQLVTSSGNVYYSIAGSTGNAPSGTTSNNTWWNYLQASNASFGPITTTGADVTTLQGIGNGAQGVLPLCAVGWSNPDIIAQSYLIKPFADTASAGYYSGLMVEDATTEGHTWSSTDTTYFTAFFTGSGATPWTSTFCVDHLCAKAF